ncbi:MAG TPA: hypothetical protein VF668_24690 [Pyrinomonadaceae bacterium]|jgi:hypothetical protein
MTSDYTTEEEYTTGEEMPPLPPGYHFTVSIADTLCSQGQLEAIQSQLIRAVGAIIREHNLRGADRQFIKTRLATYRTAPLLDEGGPATEQETARS